MRKNAYRINDKRIRAKLTVRKKKKTLKLVWKLLTKTVFKKVPSILPPQLPKFTAVLFEINSKLFKMESVS